MADAMRDGLEATDALDTHSGRYVVGKLLVQFGRSGNMSLAAPV